jgi:hypothetical protein
VVLRHSGLIFAALVGAEGRLRMSLPAMDAGGEVTVGFTTGPDLIAYASVPDLADYNRTALVWQGRDAGLHLTALEYGAGFGSVGHVRADAPREPDTKLGGYLTALGDPALSPSLLAEVYSAPATLSATEVMIEAEVTTKNCGTVVSGNTVLSRSAKAQMAGEVSFALPGCDAVGDFVMMDVAPADVAVANR